MFPIVIHGLYRMHPARQQVKVSGCMLGERGELELLRQVGDDRLLAWFVFHFQIPLNNVQGEESCGIRY